MRQKLHNLSNRFASGAHVSDSAATARLHCARSTCFRMSDRLPDAASSSMSRTPLLDRFGTMQPCNRARSPVFRRK